MVDPAGHDRGVGEEQVEHRRGDPQPSVAKVPRADHHHAGHDRQLGENRHDAGGGFVHDPLGALRRVGAAGIGVGGEDALRGNLRQQKEERVAWPEAFELADVHLGIARFQPRRRLGPGQIVALWPRCDHVGQEEHQQGNAQKHQTTDGEIGLQQRSPHHHRIEEHPHQKGGRDGKDPDEPEVLGGRACLIAAIFDRQQPRCQQDEAEQVEIAHAPEAVELEEQRDRQQRREVEPRRGVDSIIVKQNVAHASFPGPAGEPATQGRQGHTPSNPSVKVRFAGGFGKSRPAACHCRVASRLLLRGLKSTRKRAACSRNPAAGGPQVFLSAQPRLLPGWCCAVSQFTPAARAPRLLPG